jgi:hypothetical protein
MIALPAETPVTTPELFIEAIAVLLLDQLPPPVVLVRFIVLFSQTRLGPAMAAMLGGGFTVTEAEAVLEIHPFAPTPVTKNVDVCAVLVRFVKTPSIEVVFPGPSGSMPTRSIRLVLVQLYVAAPEKLIVAKGAPVQTV